MHPRIKMISSTIANILYGHGPSNKYILPFYHLHVAVSILLAYFCHTSSKEILLVLFVLFLIES